MSYGGFLSTASLKEQACENKKERKKISFRNAVLLNIWDNGQSQK